MYRQNTVSHYYDSQSCALLDAIIMSCAYVSRVLCDSAPAPSPEEVGHTSYFVIKHLLLLQQFLHALIAINPYARGGAGGTDHGE